MYDFSMKAMLLRGVTTFDATSSPLVAAEVPDPVPGPSDLLLEV
jgi:hypothetical protein